MIIFWTRAGRWDSLADCLPVSSFAARGLTSSDSRRRPGLVLLTLLCLSISFARGAFARQACNAASTGTYPFPSFAEHLHNPTYSPDGKRIAFYSNRGGSYGIYAMTADGTRQHVLLDGAAHEVSPAWSPDGSAIAYTEVGEGSAIYVMDLESSRRNLLTRKANVESTLGWSPDGRTIAYLDADDNGLALCAIGIDGSDRRRIIPSDR